MVFGDKKPRPEVKHQLTGRFAALTFSAALRALCCAVQSAGRDAASLYGVDPNLLRAIAWQESRGHSRAVGVLLPDGNRALGLMQINTVHLPRLRRAGISVQHLFDPCVSLKVGAWVLADCMTRKGASWAAVGCYFAGPASKATQAQASYVASVQRHYWGYAVMDAGAGAETAPARRVDGGAS